MVSSCTTIFGVAKEWFEEEGRSFSIGFDVLLDIENEILGSSSFRFNSIEPSGVVRGPLRPSIQLESRAGKPQILRPLPARESTFFSLLRLEI